MDKELSYDLSLENLSDDDGIDYSVKSSKHYISVDVLKFAKEMVSSTQLSKILSFPLDPVPQASAPLSGKKEKVPLVTEYLKQLSIPTTYNFDMESTAEGREIVASAKNHAENTLSSVMSAYGITPNATVNPVTIYTNLSEGWRHIEPY